MRRRILLLVTAITVVIVLAFAVPLVFLIRTQVAQRADDGTSQLAREYALTLSNPATTYTAAKVEALIANSAGRQVSVVLPSGKKVGSTPADTLTPRRPNGSDGDANQPGFGGPGDLRPQSLTPVAGGRVAFAFSRQQGSSGFGSGYIIRVFESDGERYGGADRWYLLLAGGSVALLLIGIGAGEIVTRRITRPLVRTAETAQQLAGGDTTARAPTEGPREVAEVGASLNRLADRIDELIAEERETVADMSHRLRTPLTTLRLDAEALRDPGESERVASHVSEVERMLTAVIHAARRPQREGRMPSCDATAVVGERVEFWSALTDEQGRRASVDLPSSPLPVRAAEEDLAAAVDALLENVVAHTPEGVAFSVRLAATDGGARLDIADEGPGIPDAAEVRGRSDRGSSGLGLDIARRCAEASGGAMTITNGTGGGALVTLELRAP